MFTSKYIFKKITNIEKTKILNSDIQKNLQVKETYFQESKAHEHAYRHRKSV